MKTQTRHLPAAGIATAVLLVAATTGGAVAGAMITGANIKDNTVGSADIKNKTLKKVDLSSALVTSLKGARGPAGTPGSTGAPGVSGYNLVSKSIVTADGMIAVDCPAGQTAIGGGSAFQTVNTGTQFMINADGLGGTAYGKTGGATNTLTVRVACATVG